MSKKPVVKVRDVEKPKHQPETIKPQTDVRVEASDRGGDPTINAMNEIANGVSDWLHRDLKAIIRPLQVLPEIPKHLYKLKTLIVDQFSRLFTNQMAAEMKSREANIRVANEKTKFVEDHIEEKKEQLEDSKKRVQARFENHAETISEDHEAELERLDSHAYKIIDQIYPQEVQERFSYDSPVFWDEMAEHSANAAAARSACLQEGNEQAASSVSAFLDEREAFYNELREMASQGAEKGIQHLPFWRVELEDTETGETEVEILFPWNLHEADPPVDEEYLDALEEAARDELTSESAQTPPDTELENIATRLKEEQDIPTSEVDRFREDEPMIATSSS